MKAKTKVPATMASEETREPAFDGEDVRHLSRKGYLRDPEFPLAVVRSDPQDNAFPHQHDFSELVIVLHGRGIHRTRVGNYPIATGDVFVAPSDSPHAYCSVHGLVLLNVMFDLDKLLRTSLDLVRIPGYHSLFVLEPRLRNRDQFNARLNLSGGDLAYVIHLAEDLATELSSDEPGWRLCSLALFILLICWLARHYTDNPPPRAPHLMLLGNVLSYIERNLTERMSVLKLAKVANMSRSSFFRHFKGAMGCAPLEYILGLRITRAAELLRHSQYSITRIACEVGFNHFSYFAGKFRDIMGVTPREYRMNPRP